VTKIDLPYLHIFNDRYGRERVYFRYGGRRWPLPPVNDSAFPAAYQAKLKMVEDGEPDVANISFIRASLGWAIVEFMKSGQYRQRSENTKDLDRPLFDYLKARFGAGMLRDLTPKYVQLIRNDARDRYKSATAKIVLGLISTVWKFTFEGFPDLDLRANPTTGVSGGHTTEKEHEPWPDEVLEAFEKNAPPKLKLAFYIALYSGQRRSDSAKMQWRSV
jgi:integrase